MPFFLFANWTESIYLGAMKSPIKNPHPFDMSSYFLGGMCVLGGRDFEREEKDPKRAQTAHKKKTNYELDWSFLKIPPKARPS